jgi:transcriptional antiterminator RfaH
MSYWCAARLQAQHEQYALHCLGVAGYQSYYPRLRVRRARFGRKVEILPPLFPGYAFIAIELQWHAARWCPCVINLIMDGAAPAHVPDNVIAEIRSREVRGAVELPKPPGLHAGDRVRILAGPFCGHLALYAGMKPRQRVEVLLQLLGSMQRVTLPRGAVELIRCTP